LKEQNNQSTEQASDIESMTVVPSCQTPINQKFWFKRH